MEPKQSKIRIYIRWVLYAIGLLMIAGLFYLGAYLLPFGVIGLLLWREYFKIEKTPYAQISKLKSIIKWTVFVMIDILFCALTFGFLQYPKETLGVYVPCSPLNNGLLQSDNIARILTLVLLVIILGVAIKYPAFRSRFGRWVGSIMIVFLVWSLFIAAMDTGRRKGCDAIVKSDLVNAREMAKSYYKENKTYLGVCTSDNGILFQMRIVAQRHNKKNIPTSGEFQHSNTGEVNSTVCHDTKGAWAAISSMRVYNYESTSIHGGFCVDSTGNSKYAMSLPENITVCP